MGLARSTGGRRGAFYLGLALVTCATLMLQLIQTRLLSLTAWYHLSFFVISAAMFGLTVGAVRVYLRPARFRPEGLAADLARFSAGFALSAAIGLAFQTAVVTPVAAVTAASVAGWVLLSILLSVPFFFAGVVVSLALTRSPYPIGIVYGVDLIGAAAGCILAVVLLGATDAPSAVLWTAALGAGGACLFAASGDAPLSAAGLSRPALLLALLAVAATANGLTWRGLQPVAIKQGIEDRSFYGKRGNERAYEAWNSFSRIAVSPNIAGGPPFMWGKSPRLPPEYRIDTRILIIDGDAGSPLYRFAGDKAALGFLAYDMTNLAYQLPERRRAAVIGVGGGRDLLSARLLGVPAVTGIEVNPIIIAALTKRSLFADYVGFDRLDGITLVVDEARSWLARNPAPFDVIQMSMIDTWAATGAGAFTLSENGLYTVEAWRLFLDRLTPEGVFTVSRWFAPGELNETGRLLSLAVAALLDSGAARPRAHIFMTFTESIATLIVSRAPLSAGDLDLLHAAAERYGFTVGLSPRERTPWAVLNAILDAPSRSALLAATRNLPLDLTPPTDARPFFFNLLPLDRPLSVVRLGLGSPVEGVLTGNLRASLTLLIILLISAGFVTATILVPLRVAIRGSGRRLALSGTVYFMLIGIGFMAVEIALLQRLSVFLGHPIHSLSVVLFGIILSTGVGSLLSERWPLADRRRVVAWALGTAGLAASLTLWQPAVLHAFAGAELAVRIAVSIAMIAPLGLAMGFGFPTGMRLVSAIDPRPTPWFWGINGAAGVLAASLAVATSIAFGIDVTMLVGAVCYALLIPAVLAIPTGRHIEHRSAAREPPAAVARGLVGALGQRS